MGQLLPTVSTLTTHQPRYGPEAGFNLNLICEALFPSMCDREKTNCNKTLRNAIKYRRKCAISFLCAAHPRVGRISSLRVLMEMLHNSDIIETILTMASLAKRDYVICLGNSKYGAYDTVERQWLSIEASLKHEPWKPNTEDLATQQFMFPVSVVRIRKTIVEFSIIPNRNIVGIRTRNLWHKKGYMFQRKVCPNEFPNRCINPIQSATFSPIHSQNVILVVLPSQLSHLDDRSHIFSVGVFDATTYTFGHWKNFECYMHDPVVLVPKRVMTHGVFVVGCGVVVQIFGEYFDCAKVISVNLYNMFTGFEIASFFQNFGDITTQYPALIHDYLVRTMKYNKNTTAPNGNNVFPLPSPRINWISPETDRLCCISNDGNFYMLDEETGYWSIFATDTRFDEKKCSHFMSVPPHSTLSNSEHVFRTFYEIPLVNKSLLFFMTIKSGCCLGSYNVLTHELIACSAQPDPITLQCKDFGSFTNIDVIEL